MSVTASIVIQNANDTVAAINLCDMLIQRINMLLPRVEDNHFLSEDSITNERQQEINELIVKKNKLIKYRNDIMDSALDLVIASES